MTYERSLFSCYVMRRRSMTPVVITITFKQQAQRKETRTKPEGEKTTGSTHWLN